MLDQCYLASFLYRPSPVGSPKTIKQMLEFAALHQIKPITEHFPMSKVNGAIEHLRSGKPRYRIVLDRE